MLNLNGNTLAAVAEQACRDAAQHGRWLVAIGRALVELESNPWIERGELHGLIIASPTSGNLYSANGTCQCAAHQYGRACWHRAAARLVRLHDEREAASAYTQAADAGLFGPAASAEDYSYLIDDDRGPFPLNLPDDDQVEESNRLARKIAAARATALVNELFA
jgi:hypothetical protein